MSSITVGQVMGGPADAASASGPAGRRPRVLLVDDEPFQLKLLSRQLVHLGATDTTPCQDAALALEWLAREPDRFDLVCCDLQMPGMDGVEFVRLLGQQGFAGALVLVSGEDSRVLQTAERLARAHSLRVLGALPKPVPPERLRQLLEAANVAPTQPVARTGSSKTYSADELRRAIERHELINHYQPKVELATGRVVGVETLVRWQHPQDGMVMPDRFIAVAEQHGLIDNLTRAVLSGLTGALQQARQWQDAGYPIQVAVNVSMDNLTDHSFPDFVAGEVANAGIPPSRLVLEVTESRLMRDPTATLDILTRLRLRRLVLSIDDFGTGHSSLAQLRDVPFDELKLDRGFVHGAHRDEGLGAIVSASLALASQLHIRSVAEGVETHADWQFMRSRGCDFAQGWFIGRPMPPERLLGWLAEWETRRGALVA